MQSWSMTAPSMAWRTPQASRRHWIQHCSCQTNCWSRAQTPCGHKRRGKRMRTPRGSTLTGTTFSAVHPQESCNALPVVKQDQNLVPQAVERSVPLVHRRQRNHDAHQGQPADAHQRDRHDRRSARAADRPGQRWVLGHPGRTGRGLLPVPVPAGQLQRHRRHEAGTVKSFCGACIAT